MWVRQTERDNTDGEFENENNFLVTIHLFERQALIGFRRIAFSALFHGPPHFRTHTGRSWRLGALPSRIIRRAA